jgi:hypothetical protein
MKDTVTLNCSEFLSIVSHYCDEENKFCWQNQYQLFNVTTLCSGISNYLLYSSVESIKSIESIKDFFNTFNTTI